MPATETIHRLSRFAESAVSRVKLSNSLNSCAWLCGIVVPIGLGAAYFFQGWMQIAIMTLVFLPVVLFVVSFVYFMLTDPDKLRSEDFELRKQALELIEEKGGSIPLLETSVEAIANPERPALPHSKTDGGRDE